MPERGGAAAPSSPLVLASASPRRRWLLEKLAVPFEVLPVALDERVRARETPEAFARRMADDKAGAARAQRPARWILAADTVVALDGASLGKPRDADDAAATLARLAGRAHTVFTGVTLLDPAGATAEAAVVATTVVFRPLEAEEIRAYIATGEPFDRAGSYAIQGEGAHLVDQVEGSYTNVIGLPLPVVAAWLRTWRIR